MKLSLLIYFLLATGIALTQRPSEDEGQHGGVVWNILQDRGIANPIMAVSDDRFVGIDRHLFQQMPGAYPILALWCRIFGFGLIQIRMFEVFIGGISLFLILKLKECF